MNQTETYVETVSGVTMLSIPQPGVVEHNAYVGDALAIGGDGALRRQVAAAID